MNKRLIFWSVGILLAAAGLFAAFATAGRKSPAGPPSPPEPATYSLGPGTMGMFGGGASYAYDLTDVGVVPMEALIADIQGFLSRTKMTDLEVINLREFQFAYQAEIVERSTGRHAFGLMIAKGTRQISPKAGPNIFWNTKYGPMIAEIGGGYGMVGRLLEEEPTGEMPLTEPQARAIADEAVGRLSSDLELDTKASVFYGFYEYHVVRGSELVGELDVNGNSSQVWYKDWGEPQLSFQEIGPAGGGG